MRKWIEKYIKCQHEVTESIVFNGNIFYLEEIINIIETTRKAGHKIFIAGNGGSLANASHFAQDLGKGSSDAILKQTKDNNTKRFKSIALDNSSWITALANDYVYGDVFVEQLKSLADRHDVFIGLSVSGTSSNIVNAMKWANKHGMITIGLTGNRKAESSIANIATVCIRLDDGHFGRVEDSMMTVLHIISYYFMEVWNGGQEQDSCI